MQLPLTYVPDPILTAISTPVERIDSKIADLLEAMVDTVKAHDGLGLAAPQIGINKRLIVVYNGKSYVKMINPTIHLKSTTLTSLVEGCLSIPGKEVTVCRSQSVHVSYQDTKGAYNLILAFDLFARIIQHEVDHLDGILITDY